MQGVITAIENNGNGVAISSVSLSFDDSPAVSLPSIPTNAAKALIVLEAHASVVDPQNAAHFTEVNGTTPTSVLGVPLGNFGFYTIEGLDNINNFKIIGNDAGLTHVLQITYYA